MATGAEVMYIQLREKKKKPCWETDYSPVSSMWPSIHTVPKLLQTFHLLSI